jgi:hypothetical protein
MERLLSGIWYVLKHRQGGWQVWWKVTNCAESAVVRTSLPRHGCASGVAAHRVSFNQHLKWRIGNWRRLAERHATALRIRHGFVTRLTSAMAASTLRAPGAARELAGAKHVGTQRGEGRCLVMASSDVVASVIRFT